MRDVETGEVDITLEQEMSVITVASPKGSNPKSPAMSSRPTIELDGIRNSGVICFFGRLE